MKFTSRSNGVLPIFALLLLSNLALSETISDETLLKLGETLRETKCEPECTLEGISVSALGSRKVMYLDGERFKSETAEFFSATDKDQACASGKSCAQTVGVLKESIWVYTGRNTDEQEILKSSRTLDQEFRRVEAINSIPEPKPTPPTEPQICASRGSGISVQLLTDETGGAKLQVLGQSNEVFGTFSEGSIAWSDDAPFVGVWSAGNALASVCGTRNDEEACVYLYRCAGGEVEYLIADTDNNQIASISLPETEGQPDLLADSAKADASSGDSAHIERGSEIQMSLNELVQMTEIDFLALAIDRGLDPVRTAAFDKLARTVFANQIAEMSPFSAKTFRAEIESTVLAAVEKSPKAAIRVPVRINAKVVGVEVGTLTGTKDDYGVLSYYSVCIPREVRTSFHQRYERTAGYPLLEIVWPLHFDFAGPGVCDQADVGQDASRLMNHEIARIYVPDGETGEEMYGASYFDIIAECVIPEAIPKGQGVATSNVRCFIDGPVRVAGDRGVVILEFRGSILVSSSTLFDVSAQEFIQLAPTSEQIEDDYFNRTVLAFTPPPSSGQTGLFVCALDRYKGRSSECSFVD